MGKNILRTGKKDRPKTVERGKRLRCAVCHKRSLTKVAAPAPWYCPRCCHDTGGASIGTE